MFPMLSVPVMCKRTYKVQNSASNIRGHDVITNVFGSPNGHKYRQHSPRVGLTFPFLNWALIYDAGCSGMLLIKAVSICHRIEEWTTRQLGLIYVYIDIMHLHLS